MSCNQELSIWAVWFKERKKVFTPWSMSTQTNQPGIPTTETFRNCFIPSWVLSLLSILKAPATPLKWSVPIVSLPENPKWHRMWKIWSKKVTWSAQLIEKKAFEKIQHPCTIKTLNKLKVEGNLSFPGVSVVMNPPANEGEVGSIPGLGRSPGEGNDNPLQCSCLGNPMDRGAWWATVHGVEKELVMTYQLNNNNIKGNFLDMLKSI